MSDKTPVDNSVAGLRVVVTGGASGMGAAVVKDFAAHGAHVISLDVNDAAGEEIARAETQQKQAAAQKTASKTTGATTSSTSTSATTADSSSSSSSSSSSTDSSSTTGEATEVGQATWSSCRSFSALA